MELCTLGFSCESASAMLPHQLECVIGTATPLHSLLSTGDATDRAASFDDLYIVKEELGRRRAAASTRLARSELSRAQVV